MSIANDEKDPSITSVDQVVEAQPLQIEDFDFGMESPPPGQTSTFVPQFASSKNNDNNDNNNTQSRLHPPLANVTSLPVKLNDNNNDNNDEDDEDDDGSCHCLKAPHACSTR